MIRLFAGSPVIRRRDSTATDCTASVPRQCHDRLYRFSTASRRHQRLLASDAANGACQHLIFDDNQISVSRLTLDYCTVFRYAEAHRVICMYDQGRRRPWSTLHKVLYPVINLTNHVCFTDSTCAS